MYRRSLAVAARASRVPTGARLAARAVYTSAPSDAPLPLRSDAGSARDEPPLSAATVAAIAREERFSAHNYHSIPVVIAKAHGVHVWDVDGKCYLDALAGYSAVNQGHGHSAILKALHESSSRLGLVSRAFHSARFGEYAEQITTLFGYDKVRAPRAAAARCGAAARGWGGAPRQPRCPPSVALFPRTRADASRLQVLPANTGVETGETAVKLVRRWCAGLVTSRRCPFAAFRGNNPQPRPSGGTSHTLRAGAMT